MPNPITLERNDKGQFQNPAAAAAKPDPATAGAAGAGAGAGAGAADAVKPPAKVDDKKEDLDGLRSLAAGALGIKPEDLEVAGAKPKTKEKVEKPAAAKPAAKVTKPAVAPVAPVAAPLTADVIAEGVARALKKEAAPEKPGEQPDPNAGLNQKQLRALKTTERMEKLWPDKYKGLANKYREGVKKLSDFQSAWRAEHPNQEFDPAAEEHEKWFTENEVDWEEEDYTEALADMRADVRQKEIEDKLTPKLTQLEQSEKLREATPRIIQHRTAVAKQFWKLWGQTVPEVLGEDGTTPDADKTAEARAAWEVINDDGNLNRERFRAIAEADPEANMLRVKAAEDLETEVAELYKLMTGLVKFSEKNNVHLTLGKFAIEKEAEIMSLPEAERADAKGRPFKPATEYNRLPPEQQDKFWTFSHSDLSALRAKDAFTKTKQQIDTEETRFKNWADRRGLAPKGQASQAETGKKPEERKEPDDDSLPINDDGKPVSPSAGAQSKFAAGKEQGKQADKAPFQTFIDRALA